MGEIAGLCEKHAMPAVALTDTNNMFAALEFSLAMTKAGLQPIIGAQINVRYGDKDDDFGQMVLLAQNATGYANLLLLMSDMYTGHEPSENPFVTKDELLRSSDGIIALTGGAKGILASLLLRKQNDVAESTLLELRDGFQDRLYIEIERHGLADEIACEDTLLNFAYKHNIPLVATNNCVFPDKEMYQAQDVLMCIAQGRYVSETDRDNYSPEHYFKSQEEMKQLFADLPEAILNTSIIARRCAVMATPHDPMLPSCLGDSGRNESEEFRHVAQEGLAMRLETYVYPALMKDRGVDSFSESEKDEIAKPYHERLLFEMDIICQMEFPGYFLIVSDFIRWSKENDIPVGPGRGSGAGSLVAWSMQITDLDPLRYGLLFERFLNPERVSMPDFDIDFCQDRREETIRYVQEKYGKDRVAQIITFGKLQARAVVRDVGRVLQMSYSHTDRICKMIPNNPANPLTLQEAIDLDPDLRKEAKSDEQVSRLLDLGLKLEGMHRHSGTHAAGVVIGSKPLREIVPLYQDPRAPLPSTQFSMKYAEMGGLVKFDFLGLKTLTVIKRACELVEAGGHSINIDHIPTDDETTFKMLAKGDSTGVFQMESAGMRDALRKMKPDTIEDIIALISLYRPGPMENIPTYIARKHGKEEPDYLHPKLEPCLKETFGVIIYQEQVMEIAKVLAGYSLGGADLLRRAMGKKIQAEMDKQRELFMEGAEKNKVDPKQAGGIFDLVAKFAGYGFNKSHAAAYAWIGYQTAYLKAHYPVEFLTASMNIDAGDTDKVRVFVDEAKAENIAIFPPDVNLSSAEFTLEEIPHDQREHYSQPKAIRYGLGALKGVGMEAMEALVTARNKGPFTDIFDIARTCDNRVMNKRQLEGLVKAGALDNLHPNRRQLVEGAGMVCKYSQEHHRQKADAQVSLFGGQEESHNTDGLLPTLEDWNIQEKLAFAFGAIGFYLGEHPVDVYAEECKKLGVVQALKIESQPMGQSNARMAGVITDVSIRSGNRGRYAYIALSDPSGTSDIGIFNEELITLAKDAMAEGDVVLLSCEIKKDEGGARVNASEISSLSGYAASVHRKLSLRIGAIEHLSSVGDILDMLEPGTVDVFIELHTPDQVGMKMTFPRKVTYEKSVIQKLSDLPQVKVS